MKSIKSIDGIFIFIFIFFSFFLITCSGGGGGDEVTLQSIAVTPTNPTIISGTTQQFTATGTYSDNTTQDITSSVTWSSSNTGVSSITNAGLATAIAAGTTIITATSGSISGNSTLTISDMAAVSLSSGRFGALMTHKNGEMLLPIVERDASNAVTKLTGALYINNATNDRLEVYFGDDGTPEKAVIGDYILLFSNWSEDGGTVDIAKIFTPTNYIEIFKGVSINTENARNLRKEKASLNRSIHKLSDNSIDQTVALLKTASFAINAVACGTAILATAGIGAVIACASPALQLAQLLVGNELWIGKMNVMEALLFGNDVFQCTRFRLDSCATAYLDLSALLIEKSKTFFEENSETINTGEIFVSDPAQPSGVVQPGGGLPSCSGSYQCTPGGSMHYEPCYPEGVRTCGANCQWGPCMCGANFDHLCTSPCTYTYSDWSACQPNNTATRTVVSRGPDGCTGTPVLTQSCTYTPQTCTYTYSDWSACSNNTQTRTVISSSPDGCTGTPVLSQSCTDNNTPTAGTYAGTCTASTNSVSCNCPGEQCSTTPGISYSAPIANQTLESGTSLPQFTSIVCDQMRPTLASAGWGNISCTNTGATSTSAGFTFSATKTISAECSPLRLTETCTLNLQ